jgi:hypothetical protein
VIVNDLHHLILHKIPHHDVTIAPCAGKIVAVDANAQNATFMDTFDCAEDGSSGKVPFFDGSILGAREQDLVTSPGVRIELEAIYRVGVRARCPPRLQRQETIGAREEAMLQTSTSEMKNFVIWRLLLKGLR